MDKESSISSVQFAVLMYMFSVGTAALIQPHLMVLLAGQDAWFTLVIAMIIQLALASLYMSLAYRFPNETIIEYSRKIVGPYLGTIVSCIYLLYYLMLGGYIIRVVSDFIGSVILIQTPLDALSLTFLIPALYGVFLGLGVIGKAAQILLPVALGVFILTALLLIPKAQFSNLLPVFPNGIMPSIKGTYPVLGFPLMESAIALMLFKFVKDKKKTKKLFYIGIVASPLTSLLITAYTIMVLGVDMTARAPYVVYDMAKEIHVERILERMEAIVGIIWMSTTFVKMSLCLYVCTLATVQIFKVTSYRYLLIPLVFLLLPLSLWVANNTTEVEEFNRDVYTIYTLLPGLFIPVLLLVIARIRGMRGISEQKQNQNE